MQFVARLLARLTSGATPYVVIGTPTDPYLTRYKLAGNPQ